MNAQAYRHVCRSRSNHFEYDLNLGFRNRMTHYELRSDNLISLQSAIKNVLVQVQRFSFAMDKNVVYSLIFLLASAECGLFLVSRIFSEKVLKI